MSFIGTAWARIPRGIQTIVIVAAVLFAGLLLWQFGARTSDRIGSWWFNRGVNQSQKEVQDLKNLADATLKELQAEKQRTAEERARREIAEKILADKTLNSNEKIKKYEEAMQKPITVSPVSSTSDLCHRARAYGIECGQ